MNIKATAEITQMFKKFGKLFQLPEPDVEYVTAIQTELSENKWTLKRIQFALEWLKYDTEYNEASRFNKYPTICDIYRADTEINKGI